MDITINESVDSGDENFNFFVSRTANMFGTEFNIQTASSSGSYLSYELISPSNTYVNITQDPVPGWMAPIVTCTSSNPFVTATSTEGGIQIIAVPHSSVTCNFLNKKIKHNPVIVIPGILSSYLNKEDGTEVWPNPIKALEIGGDSYLDDLMLDSTGKNSSLNITTPDIVREINYKLFGKEVLDVNYFQGLLTKLSEKYKENEDLFVFPYDWRFDVGSTAEEKLSVFIEDVLQKTGSQKVDIIAHSMGGLVTKSYIKTFSGNKIGKFIDIATPHLGAPSAFKILSFGDDLGIKFGYFGLNQLEVKKISQNFPSIYELLPTEKYFDSTDSDYKYYFDDLGDTDNNGVKGKLNFSETTDFLKNSGRNSTLIDQAKSFHIGITNIDPQVNGVETINVVGCGTPTIGKIFTLDKKDTKNEYALAYITGDGTVPLRSAQGMNAGTTYYVSGGIEHGTMPSSPNVKNIVSSILFGEDLGTLQNVSTSTTDCKLPNGKYVAVHSPVKIDIYDALGNHSGPNEFGDIEQNIPGVVYDTIEDNKFVFIPDGKNLKINLQATDVGSFSVDIKTTEGDKEKFDYFDDIPIGDIKLSGNIDLSSSAPILTIKKDSSATEQILLPDVSSSTNLIEENIKRPIKDIATTSPDVVQSAVENNVVSHHSIGQRINLISFEESKKILSVPLETPVIKKIIELKKVEQKVSIKSKPIIPQNKKVVKKVDNSNTASALSGAEKLNDWSFIKKISNYKNSVWSFFSKIFHFTK
ncbi:MAG: hypothetical protein WCF92_01485 [bacterium]